MCSFIVTAGTKKKTSAYPSGAVEAVVRMSELIPILYWSYWSRWSRPASAAASAPQYFHLSSDVVLSLKDFLVEFSHAAPRETGQWGAAHTHTHKSECVFREGHETLLLLKHQSHETEASRTTLDKMKKTEASCWARRSWCCCGEEEEEEEDRKEEEEVQMEEVRLRKSGSSLSLPSAQVREVLQQ